MTDQNPKRIGCSDEAMAELDILAAGATITALRGAVDVLGKQLDFKSGKRKRGWGDGYIDEIRSHASPRARIRGKPIIGCAKCDGTGFVKKTSATTLRQCPHCFAGFETTSD